MSTGQVTSRIGAELVEYRRRLAFYRGVRSKTDLDIEVWEFYRKHHPLESEKIETELKEEA